MGLTNEHKDQRPKTALCGDSSVVRAPDSWLKDRGFESSRSAERIFFFSVANYVC